jgi:acyl carrier protein
MNKEQLSEWLRAYLSNLVDLPVKEIEDDVDFDSYGLDSLMSVGLLSDLSESVGFDLEPAMIYHYPNIRNLTERVAYLIQFRE